MSVQENLQMVRKNIEKAKSNALKPSKHLELVAVSKTYDADVIQQVIDEGQRIFGENRVQEAQGKWPELKSKNADIELHLIGPLQSNKTADALELFDVIESVDREKIARSIAKESQRLGKCPSLFVQVNTGLEEQKAGIEPNKAVDFVRFCKDELSLPIVGLMCIPPADENPGPHFALLCKLAQEAELQDVSMGMSGDYETAIAFGATHVRVGSAIFGARDYT
ncbi:MAG: YggS family pyridoxal phosphate-dependent enzyme [Lentilitoribacter sp.]